MNYITLCAVTHHRLYRTNSAISRSTFFIRHFVFVFSVSFFARPRLRSFSVFGASELRRPPCLQSHLSPTAPRHRSILTNIRTPLSSGSDSGLYFWPYLPSIQPFLKRSACPIRQISCFPAYRSLLYRPSARWACLILNLVTPILLSTNFVNGVTLGGIATFGANNLPFVSNVKKNPWTVGFASCANSRKNANSTRIVATNARTPGCWAKSFMASTVIKFGASCCRKALRYPSTKL